MLFNSAHFFVYFPIVIAIYFLIPHRFRWVFLLGASYYFYMAFKPEYIVLVILTTCVDYTLCILMGREKEKSKRKKYLYMSLFVNLGLLLLFKYFNFLNGTIREIFINFNMTYNIPDFSVLLPMGISFYTFQTMSYTIDVYKGRREPEKHLGIFALYISFFPQLVAGPIERSEKLLPQFREKHRFNYERVTDGLKRMLWGFFKKMVIADRLSILVEYVYGPNLYNLEGFALILGTVFFAFQIYCDFSAYSDIAIGAAKVMGFDLMENFKSPYFSKSISEFWKRWHISLSTWFKDYVYIPLGGNRVSIPRHYFNLFVTFLVSGIWHGANWTFVAWGALHGFYLVCGVFFSKTKKNIVKALGLNKVPIIHNLLRIVVTFSLVCFAWIFFVAKSFSDAIYVIKHIFVGLGNMGSFEYIKTTSLSLGLNQTSMLVALFALAVLFVVELIQRKGSIIERLKSKPVVVRWACYYFLIIMIMAFGVYGQNNFIYFQF